MSPLRPTAPGLIALALAAPETPTILLKEAPRINSEHMRQNFRDHRDEPGVLTVEARIPWDVLDELRRRGHDLRVIGPWRMGTLFGGADGRGERAIAGW